MNKKYPIARPYLVGNEEKYVFEVIRSGVLSMGSKVEKFEKKFAEFIGVKYACAVSSGTAGLHLAMIAAGIKNGDEVITSPFSFVASANSILYVGAKPVFVDIDPVTYNMDPKKIEEKITNLPAGRQEKLKAILVVHIFGQSADMDPILKIAKKYKLKIIEDCCQAHGAEINGRRVGTFGDMACFSFYPTKNLGTYGDGGMILTDNKKIADVCRSLRMYGMKQGYTSEIEGYNSRLDEVHAAILNVKIKYLKQWNQERKAVAEYYIKNIKNSKIILPKVFHGLSSSWHLFVVRTEYRSRLEKYLKACKIGYGIHYPYPIHFQPAYKFLSYKPASLPQTEKFAKQILSLPIFPELTRRELIYIIDKINLFK
ncbi:MAG: DegT/DnrJ/EryC1/StrS family aminotransferase [bacterium]|nr:DegT/DnrJ/EryC1/StrS family aminotransferase [bacterium]